MRTSAVKSGPLVLAQIKGLPNWLNTKIGLLPWMTDAVAHIAFGVPLPADDGFTQGMQENVNELLNYQLEDVLAVAKVKRDELDQMTNSQGTSKRLLTSSVRIRSLRTASPRSG